MQKHSISLNERLNQWLDRLDEGGFWWTQSGQKVQEAISAMHFDEELENVIAELDVVIYGISKEERKQLISVITRLKFVLRLLQELKTPRG